MPTPLNKTTTVAATSGTVVTVSNPSDGSDKTNPLAGVAMVVTPKIAGQPNSSVQGNVIGTSGVGSVLISNPAR